MNNKNPIEIKLNNAIHYFKLGDYDNALNHLKMLKNETKHFLIHWYLSHTYFKLHNYYRAIDEVKESIRLNLKDSKNLNFLGELYLETNQIIKALKIFEDVLILDKNNKSALLNLAKLNLNIGKAKKSEKYFLELLKNDPENYGYYYSLIKIDLKYLTNNLIDQIKSSKKKFNFFDNIYSKLILAKKNQIDKKYDLEVKNLIEAHSIYLKSKQKGTHQQYNYYTNLLPKFCSKYLDINIKDNLNITPIFIMGLPRSGTTLVERIITSGKKRIQSMGETDVFDKVFYSEKIIKNYESQDLVTDFAFNKDNLILLRDKILQQYDQQGLINNNVIFTDKSISNFLYLEIIRSIFPNAKFVYCYRNPLANLIGLLRSFLPGVLWSHSMEKSLTIFDLYFNKLEKIKKKNFLDFHLINLEELTENPKIVSKNLYKFLNMEWSKECLDNINDNLVVKTASNLQVRKKITKHNLDYTLNYVQIFKDLGLNYKWLF